MPRFLVTFTDVGFLADASKDEIVLELTELELLGFSVTSAAEKTFPAGVSAVRRVFASPDDSVYRHGRVDGDVKLFVSVDLEVEVDDEDAAEEMTAPTNLLTKLVDMLPRGADLGMEGNWENEDVQPVAPAPTL